MDMFRKIPCQPANPSGTGRFGFAGGGTAGAGAAGTAGGGIGAFWGSGCLNTGVFGQAGGFAGAAGRANVSYPSDPYAGALGAAAGVGVGLFATNADSVCELKGPFKTLLVDAGVPGFSVELQVSSANGITIVSLTGSPYGIGRMATLMKTNTWVLPMTGRQCGCK